MGSDDPRQPPSFLDSLAQDVIDFTSSRYTCPPPSVLSCLLPSSWRVVGPNVIISPQTGQALESFLSSPSCPSFNFAARSKGWTLALFASTPTSTSTAPDPSAMPLMAHPSSPHLPLPGNDKLPPRPRSLRSGTSSSARPLRLSPPPLPSSTSSSGSRPARAHPNPSPQPDPPVIPPFRPTDRPLRNSKGLTWAEHLAVVSDPTGVAGGIARSMVEKVTEEWSLRRARKVMMSRESSGSTSGSGSGEGQGQEKRREGGR